MQEGDSQRDIRIKKIGEILQRNPSPEFNTAFSESKQLLSLVKEHLAANIAPVLNKEAQLRPQSTYSDKKDLSRWVNGTLRELGLAIRCSRVAEPAILTASPGPQDSQDARSRFRLKTGYSTGKETTSESHVRLWDFEFMPDSPRREPLAEFNHRRSESQREK